VKATKKDILRTHKSLLAELWAMSYYADRLTALTLHAKPTPEKDNGLKSLKNLHKEIKRLRESTKLLVIDKVVGDI
jgi:hypothetical protein